MQYVGCISNNAGNIFNINLEDIQIHGNNYTGDMKVHSCEQSDWESKTDL